MSDTFSEKFHQNEYLSFGAGVNSTALMLLLLDEGREFESVFANHGCDYPETYDYVNYLRGQGFQITEVFPNAKAKNGQFYGNLYDYCMAQEIIPFRLIRSCTAKFKIRPLQQYFKQPCTVYLGIDFGEKNRARCCTRGFSTCKMNAVYRYPLIEKLVTREKCVDIIKSHGLKVPPKSGCWFCSFQSWKEFKQLNITHPDLFLKAVQLENNSHRTFREQPLSSMLQANKLTQYLRVV